MSSINNNINTEILGNLPSMSRQPNYDDTMFGNGNVYNINYGETLL